MPIPPFDSILNTLPPHIGDPRSPPDLSPYHCTAEELCDRFATSATRKQILGGWLDLRNELFGFGVRGFQWVNGSFVEDLESQSGKEPKDIDVVTFVESPATSAELNALIHPSKPLLLHPGHVKATYFVDHFLISLGTRPIALVGQTKYWYGLFSHRRDGLWKGLLRVSLSDPSDDEKARKKLGGKP